MALLKLPRKVVPVCDRRFRQSQTGATWYLLEGAMLGAENAVQ
jgi:hypothetical protein